MNVKAMFFNKLITNKTLFIIYEELREGKKWQQEQSNGSTQPKVMVS